MVCATRGGDGWLWLALIPLVWTLGGEPASAAITACAVSAAMGILVFQTLEKSTRRRFGFPSWHGIKAFAITLLSGSYPGLTPVLTVAACSVAVSRLVLGMHFPSDVAAGMAIGAAIGHTSLLLFS